MNTRDTKIRVNPGNRWTVFPPFSRCNLPVKQLFVWFTPSVYSRTLAEQDDANYTKYNVMDGAA
ncbi:MAG: hypothetical protein LBH70_03160 [Spirochaetaceae bacterium]|nr:hypothetical protein [Spirochaetaceae bacterium]